MAPGDILGFALSGGSDIDHVGIYIGNNEMIDAPHTGANVRIDVLNSYWWSVPVVIRRFG
jgi:cell wall-associated NlpC family hydrolase